MRKLIIVVATLGALAVAPSAVAANLNVAITKVGFVPGSLTIQQGDSVTWTNSDTANHQVASKDAGFASGILKPTDTYSYTFTKAGKFTVTDPLARNSKMMVTVAAVAGGTVSLQVAPGVVTFGGRVTLSGTLSTQRSGEQLTVEAQACGESSFTRLTSVTTTTGGAFSVAVQPLKNTTYQVRYKNQTSSPVSARVRPRLTLGKIAPQRFTVTVRASDSLAGKVVSVQRWNAATLRWVAVRSAILRANSSGVAPTVVSSVTFTLKVKARTKLRVVIGAAQAGSCYAPSSSNAVLA